MLAAFDHGEGAVIVDALEILGFDAVPVDVGMSFAFYRYSANEVFDKDGVIIGVFGDVFFVRSFQKGKDFRAGTGFDQRDQIFDPDRFSKSDFEPDEAALIMGSAFADCLAAWAESGDRNSDGDFEAKIFAVKSCIEVGLVIDEALSGGDRSFFFDEVGKIEFEVGRVGLETILESAEDGGNAFHMNEATVFMEDLDKTAHVGALELVGEIDGQGYRSDGVLGRVGAVANDDRIAESFDAHFIDPQVAEIWGGLSVLKRVGLGLGLFQSMAILTESCYWAKGRDLDFGLWRSINYR